VFLPHLGAPDSLPRAGDGLSFFRRRKTRTAEASRRDAREVDEFTAITEEWGYWSDGVGELVPYCPNCARREFARMLKRADGFLSFPVATNGDRLHPHGPSHSIGGCA
jgi:hypothetical protein